MAKSRRNKKGRGKHRATSTKNRSLDELLTDLVADALEKALPDIVVRAIAKQVDRAGGTLSDWQRAKIRRYVRSQDPDNLDLQGLRLRISGVDSLRVTSRMLISEMSKVQKAAVGAIPELVKRAGVVTARGMLKNSDIYVASERVIVDGFEKRLAKTWARPFQLFSLSRVVAREIGMRWHERILDDAAAITSPRHAIIGVVPSQDRAEHATAGSARHRGHLQGGVSP